MKTAESLYELLGGWPAPDVLLQAALTAVKPQSRVQDSDRVVEYLRLPCTRQTRYAPAEEVPAILCKPLGAGPFPVVLYCHAHGNNYLT